MNGHEYVDLGLPSGTLWATCNVGATKPEEYGYYFAWGETRPKNACTAYNEKTYKHCEYYDNVCHFTKYTDKDHVIVLQPEDGAATANWGSDWRMPTKDEWQELIDNTTSIETACNSVCGRLFTANNGNSLFLPSAGRCWDYEFGHSVYYGFYWSSLLTNNPFGAWYFFFDLREYYLDDFHTRYDGQSVRAVCKNHHPSSVTGKTCSGTKIAE